MPYYYSAGITANFVACSLKESTTQNPRGNKASAAPVAAAAATVLENGQRLKEERVPCKGEDYPLGYVDDKPFLTGLVHVGKEFFQQKAASDKHRQLGQLEAPAHATRSGTTASLASPSTPSTYQAPKERDEAGNEELAPQAFGIRVETSLKSFLRKRVDDEPNDMMINVFYNGEFVGCSTANASRKGYGVHWFSGSRIGYLMERPWVILPPNQQPNGSLRHDQPATDRAKERWEEVGGALQNAVNDTGVDQRGRRPPLGDYLTALAQLEMPDVVEEMQKPGHMKYGVIDVVISLGSGNKEPSTGTLYLVAPARLVNDQFSTKGNLAEQDSKGQADVDRESLALEANADNDSSPESSQPELKCDQGQNQQEYGNPYSPSMENRNQISYSQTGSSVGPLSAYSPSTKTQQVFATAVEGPLINRVVITKGDKPVLDNRLSVPTRLTHQTSLMPPPLKPRTEKGKEAEADIGALPETPTKANAAFENAKQASGYSTGSHEATGDDKESLPATQKSPPFTPRKSRRIRSRNNSRTDLASNSLQKLSAKSDPSQMDTVMTDASPSEGASFATPILVETGQTPSRRRRSARNSGKGGLSLTLDPAGTPATPALPTTTDVCKASRNKEKQEAQVVDSGPAMTVPELCQDCVITYAEPVSDEDVGAVGIVRQIKCERGGKFVESDVMVGMRFIVTE